MICVFQKRFTLGLRPMGRVGKLFELRIQKSSKFTCEPVFFFMFWPGGERRGERTWRFAPGGERAPKTPLPGGERPWRSAPGGSSGGERIWRFAPGGSSPPGPPCRGAKKNTDQIFGMAKKCMFFSKNESQNPPFGTTSSVSLLCGLIWPA